MWVLLDHSEAFTCICERTLAVYAKSLTPICVA